MLPSRRFCSRPRHSRRRGRPDLAGTCVGGRAKIRRRFRLLPQGCFQPGHRSAAEAGGFPGLSAWLLNRPSRQVRRETRRRGCFPGRVPPTRSPAGARKPRDTCHTRRGALSGRVVEASGSGVPGEIRTHGPRIRNPVLYPAELRGPTGTLIPRSQRRRNRSTALTSAVRTPGSSAECPASGTTVSRAPGQAAARSKAVSGGQTIS